MINNLGGQSSQAASLSPASYAAGANNGTWVNLTGAQGEVTVQIAIGAVTGSVVFKVQDATDTGGTGAADLSGVTTASITAANGVAKLAFPRASARQAVRVVATVTTGPVFASALVESLPQIV